MKGARQKVRDSNCLWERAISQAHNVGRDGKQCVLVFAGLASNLTRRSPRDPQPKRAPTLRDRGTLSRLKVQTVGRCTVLFKVCARCAANFASLNTDQKHRSMALSDMYIVSRIRRPRVLQWIPKPEIVSQSPSRMFLGCRPLYNVRRHQLLFPAEQYPRNPQPDVDSTEACSGPPSG
jgi:hypothetical protein